MFYLNKLFKIPGPKDLGMSDNNHAMPSELFRNNSTELTWEDYYERVKKEYPVSFFCASTVPTFFLDLWRDITRKPKKFIYWLQCHFIPKHRYHMLDLRQSGDVLSYRYGWVDAPQQMEYALFNILAKFVEEEMPCFFFGGDHKEYMAIYQYWKWDRIVLEKAHAEALMKWSNARKDARGDSTEEVQLLWKKLEETDEAAKQKLEEMLHRLIDVRGCLWT
jgi:hypothetical protein